MSTRLSSAALGIVILLLARGLPNQGMAKPPELPATEKIICLPQGAETPTGVLLLGVGVNSETGLTGTIQLQRLRRVELSDDTELKLECGVFDTVCHCLGNGVDTCLWTCVGALLAVEEDAAGAERKFELRGLEFDVVPVHVPGPDGQPPSPKFTCPYLQHKALSPKQPAVQGVPGDLKGGVLENLKKLEEAQRLCREAERYCGNGRLQEACACYEQVRILCPGSRLDQQACARLEAILARRSTEAGQATSEEQELLPPPKLQPPTKAGPPVETDGAASAVLPPGLPNVDPKIVEVLENVLTTVESRPPARLVIIVEDAAGDAEEQTEPAATAAETGPDSAMQTLLRQMAEVALYGSCTEIRRGPAGGLRGRCQFQMSGVEFRMVLDGRGHFDFDVIRPSIGSDVATPPVDPSDEDD